MYGQTGRGTDAFQVRLPDGMRDEIKARAATNRRSMNAEIVFRLARDMEKESALTAEAEGEKGDGNTLAG